MKFSPYVTNLLKLKSNKDFRLSSDCEYLALDIVDVWLKSSFEGGRHKRRVDMIEL